VTPTVNITTTGRGGGITYREGEHRVEFNWENAMSPALALIWGPRRDEWDATFPWAIGRQQVIFDFVGSEVVRQKAADGAYEFDLELGHMTILNETGARAKGLYVNKGLASAEAERLRASVDARLAAAEATGDDTTIEIALAREIRKLSQAKDGLDRAMRLATTHATEGVKQALLWASYNSTECAPRCAETLMTLSGVAPDPSILSRLGRHVSAFDLSAAFEELSQRVGMRIDYSLLE
jgi:hypothetical protein